jgi:hypothetical protein
MSLSDKQLLEILEAPLEEAIKSIFSKFQSDDYTGWEWQTDDALDYDFLIAAIDGFIENINNYDLSEEERKEALENLKKIKNNLENESGSNT